MPELKSIQIDAYCFKRAKELLLVGLHSLESVSVGADCFNNDDSSEEKPQGRFCLKDCGRLTRVKIGGNSFTHFAACEIECLDSLEVIDIDDRSFCECRYVVFESASTRMRMMNRLA